MSTTLTNGLKLPDKGSVDWYADMQNNYTILDGAVGTIAEHTSALSGKAPLVHTHGKADITDLFNSTNTWTGDNTFSNTLNVQTGYTLGTLPQAESAVILFTGRTTDNNFVTSINFYQNPIKGTGLRFTIRNKWDNNGYSTTGTTRNAHFELLQSINKTAYMQWEGYVNNGLYPLANNTYDLGSSSYQWNNLYAKNYYYNGTAWGLDKANVWTGTNTFRQNITYERTNFFHQTANPCYFLKDTELEKGSLASTVHSAYTGNWQDKNGVNLGYVRFVEYATGKQTAEIRVSNLIKNGALDPTGSTVNCTVNLELQPSGEKSLIPEQNNDINLGTSTNKWKSLNGINPGALSLPSGDSDNINTINWDFSWNANYVTAPFDGYISIACFGSVLQINNETKSYAMTFAPGADGYICGLLPVSAGDSIKVLVTRTQTSQYEGYKFIKSRGNVS